MTVSFPFSALEELQNRNINKRIFCHLIPTRLLFLPCLKNSAKKLGNILTVWQILMEFIEWTWQNLELIPSCTCIQRQNNSLGFLSKLCKISVFIVSYDWFCKLAKHSGKTFSSVLFFWSLLKMHIKYSNLSHHRSSETQKGHCFHYGCH